MVFSILLSDCPSEKTFKTHFGELKNLNELKEHLASKGNDFYKIYVNENENHFANWIEHVFHDKVLADELRKAKGTEDAISILNDRLLYARLWQKYNKDNEDLIKHANETYTKYINYLNSNNINNNSNSNNSLSNKNIFEPQHQKFETLNELNLVEAVKNLSLEDIEKSSVTKKLLPPLPPLLPFNIEDDVNPDKIMRNSIKLENKTTIKHKKDENEVLAKELEKHFPGVKLVNEPKKNGFFDKLIGFLRA